MTTWLDRLRGEGQGRTVPTYDPTQRVFVLGADGVAEPAILAAGDYTEIKQIVDLTDWDVVAATMDTRGVVMGQTQPQPGFVSSPSDMWWFNYDVAIPHVPNLVDGAFGIDGAGDLEYGTETYSPAGTTCRVIPVGSISAQLAGVNTPQCFPASPLPKYTAQFWMNFDSVAHVTSWGVNPLIFYSVDGTPQGIEFGLSGAIGMGAHSWRFAVTHHFGGSSGVVFNGVVLDTPSWPWHLVSFVWDSTLPLADRLKMFIDDDPTVNLPTVAMANSPRAPAPGTPVIVASPGLWGGVDEMRMLSSALTPAEIAASYLATTSWPTPIDYEWVMQILVNAEVYVERVIAPSEQRRWIDFRAPVRRLSGRSEVAFRLLLREV